MNDSFSEILKSFRTEKNLSQQQLADMLFVERTTIANWESGRRTPDLDPLTIHIQTREVKNGAEITVADTGPGFGAKDNDEPHIALANIRERLEMMCNGKLTISEREGGGTVIRIIISSKQK